MGDNPLASKQASKQSIKQANIYLFSTICSLLIVLRHSTNYFKTSSYYATMAVPDGIIGRICFISQGFIYGGLSNLALYGFFVLSGYLFFRNFTFEQTNHKLKSRVKTLLIPYLIWQTIDYSFMALATNLPFISRRINTEPYSISIIDFGKSLIIPESIYWYLNYLILFVVISPLLYFLFKRRFSSVLYIIGIGTVMQFVGESRFIYSLGCYSIGGILSIYTHSMSICDSKMPKHRIRIITALCVFMLSCFLFIDVVNGIFPIPLRFVINVVGIICLWLLIDSYSDHIYNTKMLQNSFFIYCSHGIIVTIIKKLAYSLVGFNSVLMICAWLITFVLTLLLVWLLYKIIYKISPSFLGVICGGR